MKLISKPQKICAIDASTNSLAYAKFDGPKLVEYGKINFEGTDTYQKVIDAGRKTKAFFDKIIDVDAIVIEHTVYINSPKTAADLALVQGAILGAAGQAGIRQIGKVSPITWQNYLGNKQLSKEEKLEIRKANPGRSEAWIKSYERNFRKERTIKLLNIIYDVEVSDNDVADACSIGHWAIHNWNAAI